MSSKTLFNQQDQKFFQNIIHLYRRLTAPSSSIQGIEHRFQARLLSTLLLIFLFLGFLSITVQLVIVPGFEKIFPFLALSLMILVIAYIFSRTMYFKVGAIIAVMVPSIAAFVNVVSDPSPTISILYVLIGILISSVLLSWWWTAVIVTINITVASALPFIVSGLTPSAIASSMGLLAILSGLILAITSYRNALEIERLAKLAASEKRYRMLINQSPLCTIIYAPDGSPLMFNQAAIDLWNIASHDLEQNQASFNIIEDQQLGTTGILPCIKNSFAGEVVTSVASKYKFNRCDRTGNHIVDERWIVNHCYPIKDENEKVIEVVLLQQDMTEHKRFEAEIENRNRELSSLNRAISTANNTLKIEEVLQYVCLELTVTLNTSFAVAALFNDETKEFSILTTVQPAGSPEIKGARIPIEPFQNTPLAKQLFNHKEPVIISDARQSSDLKAIQQLLEQLKIASLMVLPLVMRDTIIGVIGIGVDIQREFEKAQIDLAYSITTSISSSVHNAQLFEKVQYYAATLERQVQERTRELAEANKQLQALATIKDKFVSNVSHELRTPITNIKLYHDLLTLNPRKSGQYINTLKRETERLDHIIEGLLHLSRLDQGVIELHAVSVDLNALVEVLVADQVMQAEGLGIALTFSGDLNLPYVLCDMRQIEQVVSIILTNAMHYTPEGGRVEVSTKVRHDEDATWVTLRVQDTGPGISSEELPFLFDRFYRGQTGLESNHPGTGLGLAIAKEIIERHNGRLEVDTNNDAGKGANFIIWLPVENA